MLLTVGAASTMVGPRSAPTRSWWLENAKGTALPADAAIAALPDTADIVVIGAGMTGSATAYWLQRLYGRQCVVLDARGVAGGATGRNGGHLWANPASDFERQTVESLLAFIRDEGVDCDLQAGT